MKILVTGACGLLGSHVMAALSGQHDVVGIDRHPWWGDRAAAMLSGDLHQPGVLEAALEQTVPDAVIHCAALVHVDACERNPALALTCNATLTQRLARAVPRGCLLVYISTDGIFTGETPFTTEDQPPAPRTVYGRSKLEGERVAAATTDNHLIVRTNFYGWSSGRKPTFAEWLYGALEQQQPITLFDDFFFTPIYVVDFVERLEALMRSTHRGIFHLCGRDRVSKNDFGLRLATMAGLPVRQVRRGSLKDAPLAAPRPRDMSLDSGRFCRLTGLDVPRYEAGLSRFLEDRTQLLSQRFSRVRSLDMQALRSA